MAIVAWIASSNWVQQIKRDQKMTRWSKAIGHNHTVTDPKTTQGGDTYRTGVHVSSINTKVCQMTVGIGMWCLRTQMRRSAAAAEFTERSNPENAPADFPSYKCRSVLCDRQSGRVQRTLVGLYDGQFVPMACQRDTAHRILSSECQSET